MGRGTAAGRYLLSPRKGMVEARDIGHDGLLVGAGCVDNVCKRRRRVRLIWGGGCGALPAGRALHTTPRSPLLARPESRQRAALKAGEKDLYGQKMALNAVPAASNPPPQRRRPPPTLPRRVLKERDFPRRTGTPPAGSAPRRRQGSPSASSILGMSRYFSATSKALLRLVTGSSCGEGGR